MKCIALTLTLLPFTLAAPSYLERRDLPSHTPVDVNGLDADFDIKCDKTTVAGVDIQKAVSWGVNLKVAGQTIGTNGYPHYYGNAEKFNFLDPACNGANNLRAEFPVVKGGYFDGSNDQVKKIRAVYIFDSNANYVTNPVATYCGTIYHLSDGSFKGCDVLTA